MILVALCGVGLGLWYLQGNAEEVERTVQVRYAIRMPATNAAQLPDLEEWSLRENGKVTDGSGRRSMGEVMKIELRPQQAWTVRDGAVLATEVPGKAVPVITVRAEARLIGERELRIEELRLAAGMTGEFIVGGFLVRNGEILWVEVEE